MDEEDEKELALSLAKLLFRIWPALFVYQSRDPDGETETCGTRMRFAELLEPQELFRGCIPLKLRARCYSGKLLILELNNLQNLKEKHCDRIRFFLTWRTGLFLFISTS